MPVNENDGSAPPDRTGRDAALAIAARIGRRVHQGTSNPHPGIMAVVAAALLVAAAWSWHAQHLSLREVHWSLLGLSALLVPASVSLTGAEYRLIGRSAGTSISWPDAIRITVIGNVANLLPIPGAAAIRVNDLAARSARVGTATAATVGMGVLWLGWSLALSGIALIFAGSPIAGVAMTAAGIAAGVGSWVIAPRGTATHFGKAEWLVTGSLIEAGSLAIGAARIWLTLAALGLDPSAVQAVGLVAAGAIASTVGVIPGGLGIQELIGGLLAPLIGLDAAAAIVAIAVGRVVGLAVSGLIAVSIARRTTGHS